jgi:hypothetical protein
MTRPARRTAGTARRVRIRRSWMERTGDPDAAAPFGATQSGP